MLRYFKRQIAILWCHVFVKDDIWHFNLIGPSHGFYDIKRHMVGQIHPVAGDLNFFVASFAYTIQETYPT